MVLASDIDVIDKKLLLRDLRIRKLIHRESFRFHHRFGRKPDVKRDRGACQPGGGALREEAADQKVKKD